MCDAINCVAIDWTCNLTVLKLQLITESSESMSDSIVRICCDALNMDSMGKLPFSSFEKDSRFPRECVEKAPLSSV